MKTATVTWVTYNNYGTMLQAYALQKAIEQSGHENVILSDKEILREFRADHSRKVKVQKMTAVSETTSTRIGRLLDDPGRLYRSILARQNKTCYGMPYIASQVAFDTFRQQMLHIREGISRNTLPELNGEYEAFICGSDQIWSLFEENFYPYYFLDFVKRKKIAYAPCLGTDQITPKKEAKLKMLLKDFDAISVREDLSAKQLTIITGNPVQWVADPTLLHGLDFWLGVASEIPVRKKKYLLCYFLENKNWYFEYARKLARKLGIKLLLIPNKWDYLQHSFVVDAAVGPKEFVALFRDAAYVLTDSYHGSIFSLLFEKDFQYLQRFKEDDPNSQNIRVRSLFGYLNLQNNVVTQESETHVLRLEYAELCNKLDLLREKSWEFLANVL